MKTPDARQENREANAEAADDRFSLAGSIGNGMAHERLIHKGGQP
jgi:hypothetical protein